MKINSFLIRSLILALFCFSFYKTEAQRQEISLNDNWQFRFSHQVQFGTEVPVDIPHTWNAIDALSGKIDYKRGIGNYEKKILIRPEWEGKRLFLKFNGVNSIANVFINHRHIGEHRGGYTAFIFEITQHVEYGKTNSILVRVNNAEQLDVMPLVGDFNFYGGIYRDVDLILTDDVCISPLNYASSGVQLIQDSVSQSYARVLAKIDISNGNSLTQEAQLHVRICDGDKVISEKIENLSISPNADTQHSVTFELNKPHLWNGRKDPFLYQVETLLSCNGQIIDRVVQPLGLRFFHIDPDKGFFLNGEHLSLRGVCRHQDRDIIGNALNKSHHDEDMALMLEMGVNAVRLAHYPHDQYVYDLMDKHGFIVWSEIPFVGPGGYQDKGFVDNDGFKANGKIQLKEMIRQYYNHPSICLWGLFNELKEVGDNPITYINELNNLAHQEDSSRPTTSASNQSGDINLITDAIAWNRYDGWYGGTPADLGNWLDQTHLSNPELRIGISEYGAGGSIHHQQEALKKPVANSMWHPENWQTNYHIENWKTISVRPFVWGSFVWNMFDFGAAHRTEGDRLGINDKGLVTFDRNTRKDAFFFYKANWNKNEPIIYIEGKRNNIRKQATQSIMAFTNLSNVELFVNGKSYGIQHPDDFSIVQWQDITLNPGENEIKIVSKQKGCPLSDSFNCILDSTAEHK